MPNGDLQRGQRKESKMSEEVHINLAPPLTKAQLQKNAEFQESLRLNFTPSTNQNDYQERVINNHLKVLAVLDEQFRATEDKNAQTALLRRSDGIKLEVCQWLIPMGEFQKAVELAPNPNLRNLYKAYLKAEQIDDDFWCRHEKAQGNGKPNFYREFDYYSKTKGKNLTMVRCHQCNFRNAMETPEVLAIFDRHQQKAVEKAK